MEFDKRIEKTIEGQYRATNYNFMQMGGQGSSRLVLTEIPCAHCKIAHMCSKDPSSVVNPHKCLYLQQWDMSQIKL